MEHTPFDCIKVNALERYPWPADPTHSFFLKVEADQCSCLVVEGERRIEMLDARHISGVSKQDRGFAFIKAVVHNGPARSAFGEILHQDLIQ